MRIAAGVLLIIVGVFNGIAGAGYSILGGAGNAITSEAGKQAMANANQEGMTDEQKAEFAKAQEKLQEVAGATAGLFGFGIFLLVMMGLQIAGAVTLFRSKAAKFVLVVGLLSIVAEVVPLLLFDGGFGVMKIFGLVTAVLAILAAKSYMGGGNQAAA